MKLNSNYFHDNPISQDGTYKVKVMVCKDGVTKNGNPKVAVKFKVLDGKETDSVFWDSFVMVPSALSRLFSFLTSINQPVGANCDIDSDAWIGQVLSVSGKTEVYNEKIGFRVESFSKSEVIPQGEATVVDELESEAFL